MNTPIATQLTPALAYHGEGPIWDASRERLLWLDMLAARVLLTRADGSTSAVRVDDSVCAIVRPATGGGHVIAARASVMHVDLDMPENEQIRLVDLGLPPGVRCNDGTVAQDGGLYVGAMADDAAPGRGSVVHLRPDLSVQPVLLGTTVSNGMCQDGDSSVLFIDSPRRSVTRYHVADDGSWVEPTVAVDLSSWSGTPDGMCIDVDGGIWVAHWDGHAVAHFDSAGQLDTTIDLPTPRPTSCALGGSDGMTLFITTSAYELDRPDAHAGAVFSARVRVPGVPTPAVSLDSRAGTAAVGRWQP